MNVAQSAEGVEYRGVRPFSRSVLDMNKQSDGEVPVMLEI